MFRTEFEFQLKHSSMWDICPLIDFLFDIQHPLTPLFRKFSPSSQIVQMVRICTVQYSGLEQTQNVNLIWMMGNE